MRKQFSGLTLKDHIRESHIFNGRIIIAVVIASLLLLFILFRLAYLQILQQEHYHALSENVSFIHRSFENLVADEDRMRQLLTEP